MRKSNHKKIIANILLSVFSFLLLASQVQAVTVSTIEINPSSPVWGQKFECILTVDTDESNLACDLLPINAPDTQKPLDICPKRDGLGYLRTEGNRRYYSCLADSSTGVPGPGNYRIVAWHFYSDGAYGDVIYSKNIQIINAPPPTNTPYPTPTSKNTPTRYPTSPPINTPTRYPTSPPINTPTRFPTATTAPVLSPNISPTERLDPTSFNQPTVFFPPGRSLLVSPMPSDSKKPAFTSLPDFGSLLQVNIPEKAAKAAGLIKDKVNETSSSIYEFFKKVIINFINETSF